jgi:hypothetical protein
MLLLKEKKPDARHQAFYKRAASRQTDTSRCRTELWRRYSRLRREHLSAPAQERESRKGIALRKSLADINMLAIGKQDAHLFFRNSELGQHLACGATLGTAQQPLAESARSKRCKQFHGNVHSLLVKKTGAQAAPASRL